MEFEDIIEELTEIVDVKNIAKYFYENGYRFPEIEDIDSEEFQELVEEVSNIDITDVYEEEEIVEDYRSFMIDEITQSLKDNPYKDSIDIEDAAESYAYNLVIEDHGYREITFDCGGWNYWYYYIRL